MPNVPMYCSYGCCTTHRMESHSAAMRVHVSAATAELLRQVPEAADLQLHSRGGELKGGCKDME